MGRVILRLMGTSFWNILWWSRMQKINISYIFPANFYVGLHFQKISTSLAVNWSYCFFISFYASQNFGSKFTLEKFLGHVLIFLVPAHYQRPIFPSRYRTTWKIVARRKKYVKEEKSCHLITATMFFQCMLTKIWVMTPACSYCNFPRYARIKS